MKSLTGKFSSARGWGLLLALLLGAGMMISACGDEEVPAPTTPAPPPAPPPAPAPEPEPEPEPTGPATPENLRVTATTATSITWTWDAVEGVIGYQGEFSTNATFTDVGNPFFILAPGTSQTVANLAGGSTGYFRVRSGTGTSVADLTYSDWTEGVSGTTDTPPAATALAAPSGLNAGNAEDDSITLGWSAVDDAESYEVQQRAGDAVNYSPASCDGEGSVVEETTCIVSDLESGTDYDFRVRGLPADDDDAHVAGAWGTTSGTTTGSGPATTTTTPGGMGELMVRWHNSGDNNATITFVWDRTGDALYETAMLAITGTTAGNLEVVDDIRVENPCKDVDDAESADEGRYVSVGSATSQNLVTTAPGTIMGLCVREEGTSEASFAWGISPAEEPNTGTTPDVDENKTVELTWTDVDLKADFDYELHLAKDPERPTTDNKIGTSAATSRAVQTACDNGREIDAFTPDIDLNDRSVSVESLDPYAGYLLCIRASNGAGTGAWAVPIEADADNDFGSDPNADAIYTRPAAPPRAGAPDVESTDATGSNNERLALTWEIDTRDVSNVPRNAADFNVAVYAQNLDAPAAAAMKVDDCHESTPPTGYALVTSTETDGLSGFEVSAAASENTERVDFTRRVYMCAQGDTETALTAAKGGGVGPWTLAGPYNIGKPSTSLSTDSDTVTVSGATIEIKGWNRQWFYKTSDENATCQSVSAGTATASVSVPSASTRYTVRAYASQAACDDNTRSLGSTAFTTPAS